MKFAIIFFFIASAFVLAVFMSGKVSNLSSAAHSDSKKVPASTFNFHDELSKRLKDFAKRYDLVDLKEKVLKEGEVELRIWVGFGSIYPRCLVYIERQNSEEVVFISQKFVTGKSGNVGTVEKKPFGSGKEKWESIQEYIRQHKVLEEKFLPDLDHISDPGEELIVIEMKTAARYVNLYYPVATKNKQGKIVVDLVKNIGVDFCIPLIQDIQKDCLIHAVESDDED